jgi:hypothetical protein
VDIAIALNRLWRHKLWLIPVAIIAAIVAVTVLYRVSSLVPPRLESKSFAYGTATTQLLVDAPDSVLIDLEPSIDALAERAQIYARLLGSESVRMGTARRVGVRPGSILIDGSARGGGEPAEGERSVQLAGQSVGRRVIYTVGEGSPVIQISSQAPTAGEAVRLADGASLALADYIGQLQGMQGLEREERITVTRLQESNGGIVTEEVAVPLALAGGLGVLAVGVLTILVIPTLVRYLRIASTLNDPDEDDARTTEVSVLRERDREHSENAEDQTRTGQSS